MTGRLQIVTSGLSVETSGLRQIKGQRELRAIVESEELLSSCEDLVRSLAEKLLETKQVARPGDSIPFGMSILEFVPSEDVLEIWEYDAEHERSQAGVSILVRTRVEQERTCSEHGASPIFPSLEQLFFTVSRSSDLREIEIVKGVRSVPISGDDSGWAFHDAGSEHNTEPLWRHHLVHLLEARDQFYEVIPLLALPPGFWFDDSRKSSQRKYSVWFDPGVLTE